MKYVLIVMLALLFAGCSTDVAPRYFKWGVKVCSNNGGLAYISVFDVLYPNAKCNNGAVFNATVKDFDKGE